MRNNLTDDEVFKITKRAFRTAGRATITCLLSTKDRKNWFEICLLDSKGILLERRMQMRHARRASLLNKRLHNIRALLQEEGYELLYSL